MKNINIWILAHVDAGKTSLTERLLFETGIISEIGSVDKGNTQTDSMEMERQRGITIQSAVVSFTVNNVKVNLIDTPGHPEFISEVERALRVLDGVILVISSVEGIQTQTRVLMKTLAKLKIPTIFFINKIDRMGARYESLLTEIHDKLTPHALSMGFVNNIGTSAAHMELFTENNQKFMEGLANRLADNNERFLERYLYSAKDLAPDDFESEFLEQFKQAQLYPVLFGSAITGEGIPHLITAIQNCHSSVHYENTPFTRGRIFKIERGKNDEKIAYVRVFSGEIKIRESLSYYRMNQTGEIIKFTNKVTGLKHFFSGKTTDGTIAASGDIVKIMGLTDCQVGDDIGVPSNETTETLFSPPSLVTTIKASDENETIHLFRALKKLAEQDPFIHIKQNSLQRELSIHLYGEIQKEVIRDQLKKDAQIDIEFLVTQPIYIEKPIFTGEAVERMGDKGNPFYSTIGFRIDPNPRSTGIEYHLEVELGSLPLSFHKAIEETVYETLKQGLYGWEVRDLIVTLTDTAYASAVSTASDFRKLTPLVLMRALAEATTQIYEPIHRFELEVPANYLSRILFKLTQASSTYQDPIQNDQVFMIYGMIPIKNIQSFKNQLPGWTQGEGVLLSEFYGYEPFDGEVPSCTRYDHNPLNRKEYLLHVLNSV
ncbi:elongation factor G [Paenibacillus sp. AD87]|uniref:elongation factor G n=1 Tax=Paenibacillus sp. AD87 TaxID=1528787 RepID=UPI0007E2F72E|nr:TetM/TetW/TetO/TetS family tetracycline resistance ribosomal protection protein [Paenibacillus sp. AD87]OAX48496.1 Tetracycline resistance protein TetO [Paenibacillus sp. AD87]